MESDIVTTIAIKELFDKGKNDSEIAKILNISEDKARKVRLSLGLRKTEKFNPLSKSQKQYIEKYSTDNDWKSTRQLAEELGVKITLVNHYRNRCPNISTDGNIICLKCGKVFEGKKGVSKFCSVKCCTDFNNKKRGEKLKEIHKLCLRNCANCGKPITDRKTGKSGRGSIKYCQQCIIHICDYCGKEFEMSPAQITGKFTTEQKEFFCSKNCVYKGHRGRKLSRLPNAVYEEILRRVREPISASQLAREIGVSSTTILRLRHKMKVEKIYDKKCPNCGEPFKTKDVRAKFCCDECGRIYRHNFKTESIRSFLRREYPEVLCAYRSIIGKTKDLKKPLVQKECIVCGEEFSTRFPERRLYCNGNNCRQKAYRKSHREELNRRAREWRKNNPEQAKENDKKYREKKRLEKQD